MSAPGAGEGPNTPNEFHARAASILRFLRKESLHEANFFLRRIENQPSLSSIFSAAEIAWSKDFLAQHARLSIAVISILDPLYPKALRLIPDPPTVLFARGNFSLLKAPPGVAVVGTRQATKHGLEIARRIAAFLASNNFTVVSGLALGIDAAAHEGALDVQGCTIAVLAHGLHKATPATNAALGKRILDAGGAWVSEHPVGTEARKELFVKRNRIQIGIAAGSLIVESGERSGTQTQASYCVGQKRPLFAVVPADRSNPLGLYSEGPLSFVRLLGAIPIKGKDDYERVVSILEDSRKRLEMER